MQNEELSWVSCNSQKKAFSSLHSSHLLCHSAIPMPNLRENFRPYIRPFESQTRSQKSATAAAVHQSICHLSGNRPAALYQYLANSCWVTKPYIKPLHDLQKAKEISERIHAAHRVARPGQKSSLLSFVAGVFSASELQSMGFQFCGDQYHKAMEKAGTEEAVLSSNYIQHTRLVQYVPSLFHVEFFDVSRIILRNSSSNILRKYIGKMYCENRNFAIHC